MVGGFGRRRSLCEIEEAEDHDPLVTGAENVENQAAGELGGPAIQVRVVYRTLSWRRGEFP